MFDGAADALGYVFTVKGLLLLTVATAIGSAAAILPGVSPVTMMALLLPLTFSMDRYETFMFLVALMAAGGFAGSMTSILLNVPGDGINAATCLDGYPLARQGKAGVAIGASATASGLGALFGLILLVISLPFIRDLILRFSPPEFFALSLAGVALIATVSTQAPLKGLIAGLLGMVFGFIGVNMVVGGTRYTFGLLELQDGIQLVPALIGLFALPELFQLLRQDKAVSEEGYTVEGGVWQGVMAVLTRPALFFRSAAIGTLLGLVPGVGQTVASWVSYFAAMNSSKHPESFGKGNIEGVIAPEATIDAKEGASMMPVLALGLPAGVSTAVLLSAFQIKGIFPGQRLFQNDMALIWVMIFGMVFSNLTTSALGLAFSNPMVKLTLVPSVVMTPIIMVLGAVGSYADQNSLFGITLMMLFGLLGKVMVDLGYPRPPFLVGMILLPLTEQNFHTSLLMNRGGYEFLLRPLTLGIIVITLLALGYSTVRQVQRRRALRATSSSASLSGPLAIDASNLLLSDDEELVRPPALVDVLFPLALLVLTVVLLIQANDFPSRAQMFPRIVMIPLIGLLLWQFVGAGREWAQAGRPLRPAPSAGEQGVHSGWWICIWLLALPLLIWLLGVVVGVGAYTTLFLVSFDRRRPSLVYLFWAVLGGGVMAVLTEFTFVRWLGLTFHKGIFS
jgi:putative tricarboxylic transport membrane protein